MKQTRCQSNIKVSKTTFTETGCVEVTYHLCIWKAVGGSYPAVLKIQKVAVLCYSPKLQLFFFFACLTCLGFALS